MSLYEFLVTVHVLMAVLWVGGGIMIQIFAFLTLREKDAERTVAFSRNTEWIGMRVFVPATILLLAAGIWAASEGNWDFSDAWISIGFAGWIISFIAGMGFFGPESGRIAKVVAAQGAESPDAQRRIARLLALSRIELLILVVVVCAMVIKPGA